MRSPDTHLLSTTRSKVKKIKKKKQANDIDEKDHTGFGCVPVDLVLSSLLRTMNGFRNILIPIKKETLITWLFTITIL